MNQNLIISKAPAKVLIAGGYGVLEQNNFAVSLALNNHFYCICKDYDPQSETQIHVKSPQIRKHWSYTFEGQNIKETEGKQNPFVQNAIVWTLRFLTKNLKIGKIQLLILFDQDFISAQNIQDRTISKFPSYSDNFAKTGLGSSACVLVSTVECLILVLEGKQQEQQFRKKVNVISHVANLSAQKKIGSNFDISTAVFGSHLYKNILPHRVYGIINDYSYEKYRNLMKIEPQVVNLCQYLSGFYGYIVDINKGANTRKMVSGFLANLKKQSSQIQQQFFSKSKEISVQLFEALKSKDIQQIQKINKKYRIHQQKYSKITNIPVQPEDLTPLLNKISEIQNICYVVCPGSGGYDAIFALASKDVLKEISENIGQSNSVREVKLMSDKQDMQVKEEDIKIIQEYMKLL